MGLFTSNSNSYLSVVISISLSYLALMAVVLLWNNPMFEDPKSENNRIKYILESTSRYKKPSLIIFGTSRASFSLSSKEISQSLGYGPEEGINLATPGLGIQSYSLLLDQINTSALKDIILCVDEYFFYDDVRGHKAEYVAEVEAAKKGKIYFYWINKDLIFPEFIDRLKWLKKNIQSLLKLEEAKLEWVYDHNIGRWNAPIIENSYMEPGSEFARTSPQKYVNLHYAADRIAFSIIKALRFEAFLERLKDKNVIILLLPNYPAYRQVVLNDSQKSVLFKEYINYINSLGSRKNIKIINLDVVPELGLQDIDFSDPVHLRKSGSEKLMRHLKTMISRGKEKSIDSPHPVTR